MFKKLTALLLPIAAAVSLFVAPAMADGSADAPIATAPPQAEATAAGAIQTDESGILEIEENWTGSGPWLTPREPEPDWTGTLAMSASQGYVKPELGFDVADREPTAQVSGEARYGIFRVTSGMSVVVSPEPGRGARQLGNEVWLGLGGVYEAETPFGTFVIDGEVRYMAQDFSQGIEAMRDDYSHIDIEVAYPFSLGPLEFEAAIGMLKANGIGYANSLDWRNHRLRVAYTFSERDSVSLERECYHNVNSVTAVVHRNACIATLGFTHTLENEVVWSLDFAFLQYGKKDCHYDLTVDRDGRVRQLPKNGMSSCPMYDPRIQLTVLRRFD